MPVVVDQIKEKFGGLRFYISGGTTLMEALISSAESSSYSICEECSKPGERCTAGSSWILTLCESCKVARENKRKGL
jgi:hypothetical protein